jgi:hypothetical protein
MHRRLLRSGLLLLVAAGCHRAPPPDLFARVRMPVGLRHKGLLITDRAIGTDQGQKYVYVVDDAHKVGYRRVRLGPIFDGLREIQEGLAATDRIIVSVTASLGFAIGVQARQHTRPNRARFLRTGRSPPVASHAASRRCGYVRLQTGERLSEEDLHLPDRVNFPSHTLAALCGR